VAQDGIWRAFLGDGIDRAFLHGHSFTANPLGCAAALASLDLLLAPDCQARIAGIEAVNRTRLAELAGRTGPSGRPLIARPRHCGTVAALNVADADSSGYGAAVGPALKRAFLARGLLLRPLGDVLYLLPPYCVTDDELHRAWDAIGEVLAGRP
jgi:adenosylmethionine-8-amino-7-oxononanoate aminotransferase